MDARRSFAINGSGINSLDEDCLDKIFRLFTPRERVSQISLVCKAWQRVERTHPCQPERLEFEPEHFRVRGAPAFAKWQLRDASRLREVSMGSLNTSVLYTLLECLRDGAPALGSLTIVPGSDWYREDPNPMSAVGELVQLTHLHIKEWECTTQEDIASIAHLRDLSGLRALELSEISVLGEFLKYSVVEYGMHEKLAYRSLHAAGLRFQKAISGLSKLTSLKLVNVEFMECSALKGSWTNLRSLTFQQRNGYYGPSKAQRFPDLAAMPKLEGLHIDLSDGEPPLSQVAGLRNLRELTISGLPTWGTVKVAVAPAARLTKLAVNHCQSAAIEPILPLRTLENVRDLTLGWYSPKAAPEWPAAWRQLTGLTRLVIFGNDHIAAKEASDQQKYLTFLSGLPGLRVLETSADFDAISALEGRYLLGLARCVPSLMQLVVILGLRGFLLHCEPIKGASSDLPHFMRFGPLINTYKPSKELAQVCDAVVEKIPGSWVSEACDHACDYDMEDPLRASPGCVAFTFDR